MSCIQPLLCIYVLKSHLSNRVCYLKLKVSQINIQIVYFPMQLATHSFMYIQYFPETIFYRMKQNSILNSNIGILYIPALQLNMQLEYFNFISNQSVKIVMNRGNNIDTTPKRWNTPFCGLYPFHCKLKVLMANNRLVFTW